MVHYCIAWMKTWSMKRIFWLVFLEICILSLVPGVALSKQIATKNIPQKDLDPTAVCESTGWRCIHECSESAEDGWNQSCDDCNHVYLCQNGVKSVYNCSADQWWDQTHKWCADPPSTTCWHCYDEGNISVLWAHENMHNATLKCMSHLEHHFLNVLKDTFWLQTLFLRN